MLVSCAVWSACAVLVLPCDVTQHRKAQGVRVASPPAAGYHELRRTWSRHGELITTASATQVFL